MLKKMILGIALAALAMLAVAQSTSSMITDKTGAVVSQYWDATAQQFIAVSPSNPNPVFGATYSYSHIAASASQNVVKASAGSLHTVTVNKKGTVASTVTLYDNASSCSGAVVGIIDSLNLSGPFTYDVQLSSGLCVATTGTVAPDITISYK